jgi:hypothetical protein
MYDIDFINDTRPTAQNCPNFETEYAAALQDIEQCDDIGGLCVYLRKGVVVAVFDYENECAWIIEEV